MSKRKPFEPLRYPLGEIRLSDSVVLIEEANAAIEQDKAVYEELSVQLAAAERMIAWYGDPANWNVGDGTCHDMVPKGLSRKLYKVFDIGERARLYLEKKK